MYEIFFTCQKTMSIIVEGENFIGFRVCANHIVIKSSDQPATDVNIQEVGFLFRLFRQEL